MWRQRLGRDAVVRLDQRGKEMLRIEHRALEILGQTLRGDDGLLCFLVKRSRFIFCSQWVAASWNVWS